MYVFCHFQSGVSSSCKPTLSIFWFSNHFTDRTSGVLRGNDLQFRMDSQPGMQPVYIMDFHSPAPPFPSLIRLPFPSGMLLTSLPSTHT